MAASARIFSARCRPDNDGSVTSEMIR